MTQKAQYLAEVLEKIGAPLLNAATGSDEPEQAKNIAILLSRTIQLSIEIGNMIEINKAGADSVEALRVTLAGLSSPIIAENYKNTGRIPSDADVKKIVTALESIMTFSDNFVPSAEQAERMSQIKAEGKAADSYQANIQYIQALGPVVDAVAIFSFGQPEKKLVLDVCDRIVKEAKSLCEKHFTASDNIERKKLELAFVKSLGELYTQCHKDAVTKLSAMQEPAPDEQSKALNGIWESFDRRAEMMSVLAEHLVPGSSGDPAAPVVMPAAQPTEAMPPVQQTAPAQPVVSPPQQPAAEAPVQQSSPSMPPAQQSGGYNPMSMFSPPVDQTQTPPAEQPPPASPFIQAPPAAPAEPEEDDSENGSESSGSEGATGNPMSFFKKEG